MASAEELQASELVIYQPDEWSLIGYNQPDWWDHLTIMKVKICMDMGRNRVALLSKELGLVFITLKMFEHYRH